MNSGQANDSGGFLGLDPNRTRPAKKGERILTNDLSGTVYAKRNRGVGKRSNSALFIRNSQNHASCVNAIANQFKVIRFNEQLAIGSSAGHHFGNDQLAIKVSFELQITPRSIDTLTDVCHERRIPQVRESLAIRIDVRHQTI